MKPTPTRKGSWRCLAAVCVLYLVLALIIVGVVVLRHVVPDWSGWKSIDGAVAVFFMFVFVAGLYASILGVWKEKE
ncbi:hypothetical protein [Achromobacter sp. NFACC18-2]|uniref:hypothetical protein n=1 Tax=Achromobacter sp. NFACC18-2 TaxID=1564112 RepID=UPI0008CEFCA8|nr:hypothetical protein [Achromobacter sp. NFACC18-2]SEK11988.1 hypothetical protein SAMN03159494_05560 [Achromobacter sp. NFACC18-2]